MLENEVNSFIKYMYELRNIEFKFMMSVDGNIFNK